MVNYIQILSKLGKEGVAYVMNDKFTKRAAKIFYRSVNELGPSKPQKLISPINVIWHLTNRCNLKCNYCYSNSDNNCEAELDTSQKLKLVDQLADMELPSLFFSGGESILSPDFWQITEKASKLGIKTGLFTNGTTLNYNNIKRLKSVGIEEVAISLDTLKQGSDKKTKSYYVPQVLDAISMVKEDGISPAVMITLTKHNLSELEEILKVVNEIKVTEIDLLPYKPVGRGLKLEDALTQQELDNVMYTIKELFTNQKDTFYMAPDAKFSKEILTPDCSPLNAHGKAIQLASEYVGGCMAGTLYLSILPDGKVTPCPFLPKVIGGDVKETPINKIWQESPILIRLRERDFEGKCGSCEEKAVCGGCRSYAYHLRGNLFGDDPYCKSIPIKNE